jgi:tetratricopeptide (TPR) repeat protein
MFMPRGQGTSPFCFAYKKHLFTSMGNLHYSFVIFLSMQLSFVIYFNIGNTMETYVYFIIFGFVAIVVIFGLKNIIKDKNSVLEKAQKLVSNARYDEAIEIYNKLILQEEFNPLYHTLLANIYYVTKNFQRAVVEYEIALKDSKSLPQADHNNLNKNLGIAYYKLKKLPKAFLSLFNAYLTDSSDGEVCLYIGLIYASQRKFKRAFDYINKAESNSPMSYDVHYYSGLVATQLNKRDIAVREFTFAKKFKPNDYTLDLYIGALFREKSDYMNAIRHLKYATTKMVDMETKMKAFLLLGECYKGTGLIEDAITSLEMANQENLGENDSAALEWKKNALYNLGMAYAKEGDKDKAISVWQDLKSLDFFYRDVKELTSTEISNEVFDHVTERWMVRPSITIKDVIPVKSITTKKLFDIDSLEKTVEKNIEKGMDQVASQGSLIEQFKKINIRKFKEVSYKILKFFGLSIQKEITFGYDADFKEGKATAFIAKSKNTKFLVIIKRYEENVSGIVLMNAVGSAKSMGIANILVIISSRYNNDAIKIANKHKGLTIIDRRGLVKALRVALK